jgi:ABC-type amino acid transport substrate-binding protein
MRRLFVFAAMLAATVPLALEATSAATLDRIRGSGVVRMGYRGDAKPYSYRDNEGQPAGYIVDLCREVAAAIGPNVRVEYVLVPSDRRFEAIHDGRIDLLCDPTSVTMQRREIVDFSLPTFIDGASVISRSSKAVRRFEDLAGKRVGVLEGTTSEQTLRASLRDLNLSATIEPVRDHRTGLDLLWDDKIDAYFADRGIISAILLEGGRPGFEISRPYFSYETYALAMPRDDGAFRLLVDRTLARLYRSGKLATIMEKTFGKTPLDDLLQAMIVMNAIPEK